MYKAGYKNAIRGVAMVKVDLDEDGNIDQSGSAYGSKTLNFNIVNADNDLAQNTAFTNLFLDWLDANAHNSTQKVRVTWEV